MRMFLTGAALLLVGAALVAGAQTPRQVAQAGRVLAALFGSLSVLLVWRLLRETLLARYALVGAALAAAQTSGKPLSNARRARTPQVERFSF